MDSLKESHAAATLELAETLEAVDTEPPTEAGSGHSTLNTRQKLLLLLDICTRMRRELQSGLLVDGGFKEVGGTSCGNSTIPFLHERGSFR